MNIKRTLVTLTAVAALALAGASTIAASPPPGNDGNTCHGANLETCRPDPQPSDGQDCNAHGNNPDGNDDHCGLPTSSPSPTPTPSVTPSPTASTSPTPAPSPTPTITPTPRASTSPSPTPTPSVVTSPVPSATPTLTLPPTDTEAGNPTPPVAQVQGDSLPDFTTFALIYIMIMSTAAFLSGMARR